MTLGILWCIIQTIEYFKKGNKLMDNDVFSSRLRQIRTDRGLSQTELAEKVGVSKTSLSAYESGSKKPSYEIVAKIAKACGTSMDWLCGLDENNGDIDNFGEFLRLFFKLIKSDAIYFDSENFFGFKFQVPFSKFEKAFIDTFKLYKNGTINEDLFTLWCKNEIEKNKNISISEELYGMYDPIHKMERLEKNLMQNSSKLASLYRQNHPLKDDDEDGEVN